MDRAIVLRAQLAATLGALATAEEEAARVHDTLADQAPRDINHYRRAAAEARRRAVELRAIQRQFAT